MTTSLHDLWHGSARALVLRGRCRGVYATGLFWNESRQLCINAQRMPHSRFCPLGAILAVQGEAVLSGANALHDAFRTLVTAQVKQEYPDYHVDRDCNLFVAWQDEPARTLDEIVELCDRAVARA